MIARALPAQVRRGGGPVIRRGTSPHGWRGARVAADSAAMQAVRRRTEGGSPFVAVVVCIFEAWCVRVDGQQDVHAIKTAVRSSELGEVVVDRHSALGAVRKRVDAFARRRTLVGPHVAPLWT